MKEIVYDGNIFTLPDPGKRDACVVTTNGMIRRNGRAVMGAGIARYCRDTFTGRKESESVDKVLGDFLKQEGNHACCLGWQFIPDKPENADNLFLLFSFPTKDDWKDPSKPELIRQSCREIMRLCDEHRVNSVFMPCPGCSNGKLDYWNTVRPILREELDDRFTVCVPGNIMALKK